MSRDYKPRADRAPKQSQGNPFVTGLLIGFLLGVAASLAVVMMIKGGESPFADLAAPTKPVSEKIAETAKEEAAQEKAATEEKAKPTETAEDKTRFDFYTILPGSERQVTTEEVKNKEQAAEPSAKNTYFLQVGAFQTEDEADNMKATLALQGFEAVVQTATIPNKGVWHRVRVGPLKNLELINKTKADLASNGFKSDLITINNETQ
ncbi:SPOR domain-containing protein [Methylotenera mobilis]|uniref:Sporulation domain protein n=1 Tax=Methylotenera mobilis (strain JLW8 / ATCC BAA-1282 / DSM 17540) TaxID=583345 RepID=C6WTT1_METML|nr:SPOR domain-containing protein [Methylotenera mobilis]ACT49222.1 Sporulation domain protein [Methylotenera mobilis JLW8]